MKQAGHRASGDSFKGAADVVVAIEHRILDPKDLVNVSRQEEELLLAAFEFSQHAVDAFGEAGKFVASMEMNTLGDGLSFADAFYLAIETAKAG